MVSARRLEHEPMVRAGFAALAEGAGGGRLGPDPQPGHGRRQRLQRRALGRHGAAAAGAGRRGRHRRAGRPARACRSTEFFLGRPPDRARSRASCWSSSIVPAPGAGSGGTYLRHTPRRELDIAVVGVASQLTHGQDGAARRRGIALGGRRAGAAAGDRGRGSAWRAAGHARADRARGRAGRRPRQPDLGSARLGRVPPAPGPRPDPPHAHDRASSARRGRSTSRNGAH